MENQKQDEQQKQSENKNQKFQFIWVILGIAAVLLIWLLSSWVY